MRTLAVKRFYDSKELT